MKWQTPEERRAIGQAIRKKLGRQQHSSLNPSARKTTAFRLLERAGEGRVPKLLKLKYKLMAASPFGYFRGAVPVMAADLAATPNTGIVAQLCGDAHVRNLGVFAAPDGRLVFDINDFDETIQGPFEWDLKRMAASIVLAGRESDHSDASASLAVVHCIESYTAMMQRFAAMPRIEAARYQVHRIDEAKPVHAALLKAERATPQHTRDQLTEPSKKNGRRRFRQIEPNLTRVSNDTARQVLAALKPYTETIEPQRARLLSFYRPIDVAFKVVGTGSVGLRDYCIYFEGNGPDDPLFLQIKEEAGSAWAPYLKDAKPPADNGRRVVAGQRAMQTQSDPFLGYTRFGGRDYLVRQLNDHKGSIELADLAGDGLAAYAGVCGELLARGHSRSGDPQVIAGYLGSGGGFPEAIAQFAVAYADVTHKDCEDLRKVLHKKKA